MREGTKARQLCSKILATFMQSSADIAAPDDFHRMLLHPSFAPLLHTFYRFFKALQCYTHAEKELEQQLFPAFQMHFDEEFSHRRLALAEATTRLEKEFNEFIEGMVTNPYHYLHQKGKTPFAAKDELDWVTDPSQHQLTNSVHARVVAQRYIKFADNWDHTAQNWQPKSDVALQHEILDALLDSAISWDKRKANNEATLSLKWFLAELHNPHHLPTTKLIVDGCYYQSYAELDDDMYERGYKGILVMQYHYNDSQETHSLLADIRQVGDSLCNYRVQPPAAQRQHPTLLEQAIAATPNAASSRKVIPFRRRSDIENRRKVD